MKLKQITFTGIDKWTDLSELKKIQKYVPNIEFGVLLSRNWKENGNRYFDPSELYKLRGLGLNLSCHLCGYLSREAVNNNWKPAIDLCEGNFDLFKRCQLNVSNNKSNPEKLELDIPDTLDEVIIQQHSVDNIDLWKSTMPNNKITILLDASGGQGIDTPVVALDSPFKVGYAGGISFDNISDKVSFLENSPIVRDYWVDMESSVRTDDKFDIKKVMACIFKLCIDDIVYFSQFVSSPK